MNLHFWHHSSASRGFTLVEIAVVAAIIGFLSTTIIVNFSRNRIRIEESTAVINAQVRIAQTQAVSSAKYSNYVPCGYGIHYVDSTHFALYVGPNAANVDCKSINHNYGSSEDVLLNNQTFQDARIQFKSSFSDIYFEPPDPTTYINNSSALNQAPQAITIGVSGTACPTSCKTVYVYPSGKIDVQ